MVDRSLEKIINDYDLVLEENIKPSLSGSTTFINIRDSNKNISFDVQYMDDKIFTIYFWGSQFYDVSDNDMYIAIGSILSGDYEIIHKGIFRKKRIIRINSNGNKHILPTIVEHEVPSMIDNPIAFTRRTK